MKQSDTKRAVPVQVHHAQLAGYSGPFFPATEATAHFPPNGMTLPSDLVALLNSAFSHVVSARSRITTDKYEWYAAVEWTKRDSHSHGEFMVPANGSIIALFPMFDHDGVPEREIAFYLSGSIGQREIEAIAEQMKVCFEAKRSEAA